MEAGEFVKGAWYPYPSDPDSPDDFRRQVLCEIGEVREQVKDLDERTRTIEMFLSQSDETWDDPEEGYLEDGTSIWSVVIISTIVSAMVVGVMTIVKMIFL